MFFFFYLCIVTINYLHYYTRGVFRSPIQKYFKTELVCAATLWRGPLGALQIFTLSLPSTQIGSLSKQILSSKTEKSHTAPNLASTARVRALEYTYRPNTASQIPRYGQVLCPDAKSTSCSSTTRTVSYELVFAVLQNFFFMFFIASAIIRMFIRRSAHTISIFFFSVTVSGVETVTGRSGRWSSSVLSRPSLKRLHHSKTHARDRELSP